MNKSKRKFQLSRERIRNLSSGQLDAVIGGATTLESLRCSIDDTCPFPSHGPCSLPSGCVQSNGLRCI